MENQTLSNVKYIQKINLYKIACSTYTANNAKSKKKGGSIKPRVNPPDFVEEIKWGIYFSWPEILQKLACWEVQNGNRCHSEWQDAFAGLAPYVEDHTAAVLQLIQPCEALYCIATFTLPNA